MTVRCPVAVVTGGTHGIGRHTLELLAGAGWSVAICSRDASEARTVAASTAESFGVDVLGAGVDVRSFAAVRQFAADVVAALGPVQAVVANAGVLGPVGPLHVVDMEAWANTVAIDLVGVAYTWSAFAAEMISRDGRGHLLTLSGGGVGGPNMAPAISAYTASKAAVVTLTETVASELAPFDIAVNAIAPGAVATRFTDPVLDAGPALAGDGLYVQTQRQRAHPDSLADFDRLLLALLDPSSTFVTGRLLSAKWDHPAELAEIETAPGASSRHRLRRIDGVLFDEVTAGASA